MRYINDRYNCYLLYNKRVSSSMQAREKAGGVMDTQMLWLEADELRRLVGYKKQISLVPMA